MMSLITVIGVVVCLLYTLVNCWMDGTLVVCLSELLRLCPFY